MFRRGCVCTGRHLLGEAEVEQVRFTLDADEDVGRLEIAVDHTTPMGGADGITDLAEDLQGLNHGQFAAFDVFVQGPAVDAIHDEIVVSARAACVVNRHDVRMLEVLENLDLALEPSPFFRRGEHTLAKHFNGDNTTSACLHGSVHDSLTTAPDLGEEFVMTERVDKLGWQHDTPARSSGARWRVDRRLGRFEHPRDLSQRRELLAKFGSDFRVLCYDVVVGDILAGASPCDDLLENQNDAPFGILL